MQLGLKVDVCTYEGMRYGVPELMRLFDALNMRASFFVTCGPDHSGRAIRRVFRRGFFEKMRRTNAVGTYGWRTLLYGTLLPGPHVARSCAPLLRSLQSAGHEVAVHGYDHVYWHDALARLGPDAVRSELSRAVDAFAEAAGTRPQAFGAPGWQCSATSFAAEDSLGLLYHSDTRGHSPFVPEMEGQQFRTMDIPTTLPTLDETLGRCGSSGAELARFYVGELRPDFNVYTAHAEMEGRQQLPILREWLEAASAAGATVLRLIDIVQKLSNPPVARVTAGPIAGRAGTVAWQEGTRG